MSSHQQEEPSACRCRRCLLGNILHTLLDGFATDGPCTSQNSNRAESILDSLLPAPAAPPTHPTASPIPIRVRLAIVRTTSHRAAPPSGGYPTYEDTPFDQKLETCYPPISSIDSPSVAEATVADMTQYLVEDLFVGNKEAHFWDRTRSKFARMLLGGERERGLPAATFRYRIPTGKAGDAAAGRSNNLGKAFEAATSCVVHFSLVEETEGLPLDISPSDKACTTLTELKAQTEAKKLDLILKAHVLCSWKAKEDAATSPRKKRKIPEKVDGRAGLDPKRSKVVTANKKVPVAFPKHPNGIPPALAEAWENQKAALSSLKKKKGVADMDVEDPPDAAKTGVQSDDDDERMGDDEVKGIEHRSKAESAMKEAVSLVKVEPIEDTGEASSSSSSGNDDESKEEEDDDEQDKSKVEDTKPSSTAKYDVGESMDVDSGAKETEKEDEIQIIEASTKEDVPAGESSSEDESEVEEVEPKASPSAANGKEKATLVAREDPSSSSSSESESDNEEANDDAPEGGVNDRDAHEQRKSVGSSNELSTTTNTSDAGNGGKGENKPRKDVEKVYSAAKPEDATSSESSSSSGSSSEESEDEDNGNEKEGSAAFALAEDANLAQTMVKDKNDNFKLLASGKQTPYDMATVDGDANFTQESAIVPTKLFEEMGKASKKSQHKRGGDIESSTPAVDNAQKDRAAGHGNESDGDSSSSSSSSSSSGSSSDSDESDEEESKEEKSNQEKDNTSKPEKSASGEGARSKEKPQFHPLPRPSQPSAPKDDGSSGSSSNSSDEESGSDDDLAGDGKEGAEHKVDKEKGRPAGAPKRDNEEESSSSSSSSSDSSSSDSSSDSDSDSSSDSDKEEETKAEAPASRSSILPVVHSSRGRRRRTPLIPKSRKIVINTSNAKPRTQTIPR